MFRRKSIPDAVILSSKEVDLSIVYQVLGAVTNHMKLSPG